MLDHDQRVAQVAETEQGLDQTLIVPLVKTDAWLIEDVEDTDETGTDLCGEPDSLRLSSGQSGRRPAEGQIVEPNIEQELDPRLDLFEHTLGDGALPVASFEILEELFGLAEASRRPWRCCDRQS